MKVLKLVLNLFLDKIVLELQLVWYVKVSILAVPSFVPLYNQFCLPSQQLLLLSIFELRPQASLFSHIVPK